MERLKALLRIKELVKENGVIPDIYRREDSNGECKYCVAGLIFKEIDPSILDLIEENDLFSSDVSEILLFMQDNNPELYKEINNFGIGRVELLSLQGVNDSGPSAECSTEAVLEELDDLIECERSRGGY